MSRAASIRTFDVIVPARDAGATIGRCLDSLLLAGMSADAITVVDDGSRDVTASLVRERDVRCILATGGTGAAAARNLGAARTGAELILFVDADVCVAPDAIGKMGAAFAATDAPDAIFGSYDDSPAASGLPSRVRNLLHHHVHQMHPGPAETFWTGLGAVRRQAFAAVGGFAADQRMMEDVRFGYDLRGAGYSIELRPDIQGTHLKRWTLWSLLRTDLMDRAIPWSRLLLARPKGGTRSLNVSRAGRTSVVASVLGLLAIAASLPLAAYDPALGIGMLFASPFTVVAVAFLNRPFLALVARRLGAAAIVPAALILWLHFLMAGCGYAWVLATRSPFARKVRASPSG